MENLVQKNQELVRNIIGEKCRDKIKEFFEVIDIIPSIIVTMSRNWHRHVFVIYPQELKNCNLSDKAVYAVYDKDGILQRINVHYYLFSICLSFLEEILGMTVEKNSKRALVFFNDKDDDELSRLLTKNGMSFNIVSQEVHKMLSERFKMANTMSKEYVMSLVDEIAQHSHLSLLRTRYGISTCSVKDKEKGLDFFDFVESDEPSCSYIGVHPDRFKVVKYIVKHVLPFTITSGDECDLLLVIQIMPDKIAMQDCIEKLLFGK